MMKWDAPWQPKFLRQVNPGDFGTSVEIRALPRHWPAQIPKAMKRFLRLTLVLLSTSILASAQDARIATLRLRLSNGGTIAVNLDGQYIFRNTNSLTLDGIRPGWHRIEVYRDFGEGYRPRRIYTGTIRLRRGTFNDGLVDIRMRTLQLRTEAANAPETGAGDGGSQQAYDPPRNNPGPDDVYPGSAPNEKEREGYGSFPHGRSGGEQRYQRSSFSDQDMDDLHTRVDARITDGDKEKLLKNAVGQRSVNTAQVRQMLGWLTFESTRLEFAEWAYARVSDPGNYWKLEDVFSFDSSKEEFSKAIRH